MFTETWGPGEQEGMEVAARHTPQGSWFGEEGQGPNPPVSFPSCALERVSNFSDWFLWFLQLRETTRLFGGLNAFMEAERLAAVRS